LINVIGWRHFGHLSFSPRSRLFCVAHAHIVSYNLPNTGPSVSWWLPEGA
jgi:hypothetical protein